MNTERSGGSESVSAPFVEAAGLIRSSHGNASAAPAPRKTVLREIRFALFIYLSPHLLHHHGPLDFRRRRRGRNQGHFSPWLFRNGVLNTISRISVRAR